MSYIAENIFNINDVNLIPGNYCNLNPIVLNIQPQPNKPTIFIINYISDNAAPTGQYVKIYKIGIQTIELPILGDPVLDIINRTLTITIPANSGLNAMDTCIIQFEIEFFS